MTAVTVWFSCVVVPYARKEFSQIVNWIIPLNRAARSIIILFRIDIPQKQASHFDPLSQRVELFLILF